MSFYNIILHYIYIIIWIYLYISTCTSCATYNRQYRMSTLDDTFIQNQGSQIHRPFCLYHNPQRGEVGRNHHWKYPKQKSDERVNDQELYQRMARKLPTINSITILSGSFPTLIFLTSQMLPASPSIISSFHFANPGFKKVITGPFVVEVIKNQQDTSQ